jgi:SAM-dependent methyltransferase
MNQRLQAEELLSRFPRVRPELPPNQRAGYVEHYRTNRLAEQGLARSVAKLEAWMHRQVAQGVVGGSLLELGAGTLNHFPYLPSACVWDVVEPFAELWSDSSYQSHVHKFYSDIDQIPQPAAYDCIFSVAVLEHLTDLPFVLARAGLMLREGGTFRAAFPSEGGLLWGLGWRLTTGIQYRLRRGLDYANIMRYEHLNTASEILILLDHFYEEVEITRFPLPLKHLSFYTTAIARSPRLDHCRLLNEARVPFRVPSHE